MSKRTLLAVLAVLIYAAATVLAGQDRPWTATELPPYGFMKDIAALDRYQFWAVGETGNMLELGAGLLGLGRKKSLTSQMSKNRMTQQAKAEVDESVGAIRQFEAQIAEKEAEREQVVREINDRWADVVNDVTEIAVAPKKADVFIDMFGVAWQPFYVLSANGERYELPGFGAE